MSYIVNNLPKVDSFTRSRSPFRSPLEVMRLLEALLVRPEEQEKGS